MRLAGPKTGFARFFSEGAIAVHKKRHKIVYNYVEDHVPKRRACPFTFESERNIFRGERVTW